MIRCLEFNYYFTLNRVTKSLQLLLMVGVRCAAADPFFCVSFAAASHGWCELCSCWSWLVWSVQLLIMVGVSCAAADHGWCDLCSCFSWLVWTGRVVPSIYASPELSDWHGHQLILIAGVEATLWSLPGTGHQFWPTGEEWPMCLNSTDHC